MAQLTETFDISTLPVGNTGSYDPLPAGWYSAAIAAAEIKPTKDGTGQYIKIKYQVTGPTHSGRMVFGNINIRNASQKAEEIGRQQLGDIMRALNISRLTDTDQMIGGMLSIKLDIRPADGQYQAQNEVRGFRPFVDARDPFPAPAKPSPAPALGKGAAPPWVKK